MAEQNRRCDCGCARVATWLVNGSKYCCDALKSYLQEGAFEFGLEFTAEGLR